MHGQLYPDEMTPTAARLKLSEVFWSKFFFILSWGVDWKFKE